MKNWEWARYNLESLRRSLVALEHLEDEKEEAARIAAGLKSPEIGGEIPTQGMTENASEARMLRYLHIVNKLEGKMAYYIERKERVIEEIDGLEGRKAAEYSQILYKRYVEGKKMQVIAREMHYSREYLSRQHKRALLAYYDQYLSNSQDDTFT